MLEKEKKVWTEVIDMYKSMSFLWDKTNPNYLNRDMRRSAFEAILEIYKLFDSDANLSFLKRKIENMRTTYCRELKKVKASKENGTTYVPILWYYDLLGFLDDNIHPKSTCESTDNLDDVNEDSQESSGQQSFVQILPTTSTQNFPEKSKWKTFIRKDGKILSQGKIIGRVQKLVTSKEEDWEVFGKSIGLQLKDVNKHQLTIAQKLISDTIYYARTGKLCENTSICLGVNNQMNTPTTSQYWIKSQPMKSSFLTVAVSPEQDMNSLI